MLTMQHRSICKNLALTSLTSSGRSVGIVQSWTLATEFFVVVGMLKVPLVVFLSLPLYSYSTLLLYLLYIFRISSIYVSIYMSDPSELCLMVKRSTIS
jgi:hypothetical protein